MHSKAWFDQYSIENKGLYYKLSLIFGLFFIVPVLGFLYFAVKYEILYDDYLPLFFVTLLIFFFFGFNILRRLFDSIHAISKNVSRGVAEDLPRTSTAEKVNEFDQIIQAFQSLECELKNKLQHLDRKSTELATLKELSDLCYMTYNSEDLLYLTLERALKLVDADIGSAMILNRPGRDAFIIEATIGLSEFGKKGTEVFFDDSIARYAVLNKAPLLVENIETDERFGRQARARYATKSFICMPLKSMHDVIGVLTISRRKAERIFTQADVDVLTPLLGSAAFTYDNLSLMKENETLRKHLISLGMISRSITSSLKGSELMHALFQEMKKNIPFDLVAILGFDANNTRNLTVMDYMSFIPVTFNRGDSFPYGGSFFDAVIKQLHAVFIEAKQDFKTIIEQRLLQHEEAHSTLAIPLKAEGKIIGVLLLYNISQDEWINHVDFINLMSDHLVEAMEKDRMLGAMIKRDQELETLRLIGITLSSSMFRLAEMLSYTMEMIKTAIDVEAGYLLLIEKDALTFAAAFNFDLDKLQRIKLPQGEGIAGYVAHRGLPVITHQARRHPHFSGIVDRETGFTTRSILAVPMISQGHVIGVIEILNKKEGLFTAEDEQLLQSVATSVTIALENARLYEETVAMAEKERGIRHVFQKFVPKAVVDKIITGSDQDGPIIEEFKTLTLLNIDIRGFSPLAKKIGPQKTVAMLNHFFSVMGNIVFDHHGIVDKYLGDGFLALFGAPAASADDADNAVLAAREMRQAMAEVNRFCKSQIDAELTIGLSIHTGEVVVGNIGFEKKMDYTVIGDAVNFVFKLQALCKEWPNDILLSETTVHAAKSRFDLDQIGLFEIESAREKLKIYRLVLNA